MTKNNVKVPNKGMGKTEEKTCPPEKSERETIHSECVERWMHMHKKLKATYDFSLGKILKRGRSITDGEFETRMRQYIFITGHADIPMSVQAMKSGAIEFLTKPIRDQELLDAIQFGLMRDRVRRETESALADLRRRFATLSPREREIMIQVARGRLSKQIAGDIGIADFVNEAEEAFVNLDIAEEFSPYLLRQYLLVGAKIAIIDFIMRSETQATIRSQHQKEHIFARIRCRAKAAGSLRRQKGPLAETGQFGLQRTTDKLCLFCSSVPWDDVRSRVPAEGRVCACPSLPTNQMGLSAMLCPSIPS